jgi:serine O-acetyltransferase
MTLVRDLRADYERHGSSLRNMGFWAVATYRLGRWANEQPPSVRRVGGSVYGALALFVEVASGIVLNREATIGEDFHLVHSGNIKIHPACIIGKRVGIMHDVTLGEGERAGAPVIGDDVFIGAGAKVLGPVHIGDRARIAANSLVINDVPADCTAIGVPAKILHYTGRHPTESSPPATAGAEPVDGAK